VPVTGGGGNNQAWPLCWPRLFVGGQVESLKGEVFRIFLLVPVAVTTLLTTRTQARLSSMQTSAQDLGEDDGYVDPELVVRNALPTCLVWVCACVGVWVCACGCGQWSQLWIVFICCCCRDSYCRLYTAHPRMKGYPKP
jgi:hypothetical protein